VKIVAVCGQGIGTSVLLKMNAEKVLRKLGSTAEVVAADVNSARNVASDADLLLTSADMARDISGVHSNIVSVNNFTDLSEIEQKLAPHVDVAG
jgi:PTS system ascorbate-specific IIB component